MNDPLMARYQSTNAENYDAARQSSDRWKEEEAAFPQLFRATGAQSVVDCPFGTGRWYRHYQELTGPVIGIDISADMLDMARRNMGTAAERLMLIEADIFTLTPAAVPRVDLVVSTRFVNWLDFARVETLLERFTGLAARHLILGATVLPQDAGADLRAAFQRFLATPHKPGAAVIHVHEENRLLATLTRLGWTQRRRLPIFQRLDRANFFYLFERLESL